MALGWGPTARRLADAAARCAKPLSGVSTDTVCSSSYCAAASSASRGSSGNCPSGATVLVAHPHQEQRADAGARQSATASCNVHFYYPWSDTRGRSLHAGTDPGRLPGHCHQWQWTSGRCFSSMRLIDPDGEDLASFQDMLQNATSVSDGAADGAGQPSILEIPDVSSVAKVIFDSCWKAFEETYNLQVGIGGGGTLERQRKSPLGACMVGMHPLVACPRLMPCQPYSMQITISVLYYLHRMLRGWA